MQFAVYQNEVDDANPGEENNPDCEPKSNNNIYINKSAAMDNADPTKVRMTYPKIIYAARTHSQLSQVIK